MCVWDDLEARIIPYFSAATVNETLPSSRYTLYNITDNFHKFTYYCIIIHINYTWKVFNSIVIEAEYDGL